MDNKIKFRILGVLLIIGLVIILLPLVENNKGLDKQKLAINVPPFPDQAVQVDSEPPPLALHPTPQQTNDEVKITQEDVKETPDDTIKDLKPKLINQSANDLVTGDKTLPAKKVNLAKGAEIKPMPRADKFKQVSEKPIKPNKDLIAKMDGDEGLVKLKEAVWVIQLGSFSDKANALRLVNQLRQSGYKAFIKQAKTAFGHHTRVFIGPINKQTSARDLASKLETDFHLRAMVVNYNPMEL